MTLQELMTRSPFTPLCPGEGDRQVTGVYCCDLLSIAMGRAPADCAWVTMMGNVNTIAVAVLADVACVVLAEGVALDEEALKKARERQVAVLATPLPVFEAAKLVDGLL